MPTEARRNAANSRRDSFSNFRPATSRSPSVGWSRPPNRFNRVDLPEPDLPRRATRWPLAISIVTPHKA